MQAMNLRKEQTAFLSDVCKLIQFASAQSLELTGGELYRTLEQQKIYFNAGKTKTMNSLHLRRLAIDFNFFKNDEMTFSKNLLQPLGDYWESLHPFNSWGGNGIKFVDMPHFSRGVGSPEFKRITDKGVNNVP